MAFDTRQELYDDLPTISFIFGGEVVEYVNSLCNDSMRIANGLHAMETQYAADQSESPQYLEEKASVDVATWRFSVAANGGVQAIFAPYLSFEEWR